MDEDGVVGPDVVHLYSEQPKGARRLLRSGVGDTNIQTVPLQPGSRGGQS